MRSVLLGLTVFSTALAGWQGSVQAQPPAPPPTTADPATQAGPASQPAPAQPVAQPAPAQPVAQPAPTQPVAQPAPAQPAPAAPSYGVGQPSPAGPTAPTGPAAPAAPVGQQPYGQPAAQPQPYGQPAQPYGQPAQQAPPPPPPSKPKPDRFRKDGGYVQIAPGALAFDTRDTTWLGYHYGIGFGGYRVQPGGFAYSFGLHFEHWLDVDGSNQRHLLRPGVEFRVGGSGKRFFAYALFAPSASIFNESLEVGGVVLSGTDVGLGLGFGAGVMGLITKSFYIGTEFGGDVDLYFDAPELYHIPLSWKVLLGFRFGG